MLNLSLKKYFANKDQFQFKLMGQSKKIIGSGSFGTVRLALHKGTNRLYAIKIINLKEINDQYELKNIERQICIHYSLDHPHIIKLWDTIIYGGQLYMIMDFAQNGNLFYFQNKRKKFTEQQAFKFFFQCAKAIEYLHKNDIMHRDIKVIQLKQPQNLLLDQNYNIRLCDFGWSCRDITQLRKTFCGTYQYMAPQMVMNKYYDYRIDIWSLGILLYQLLHGTAPFKGQTQKQIAYRMKIGQYQMASSLSQEVKNLIRSILQSDPQKRPSFNQIFKHQWIIKINEEIIATMLNEIPVSPTTKASKGKQKKQSKRSIIQSNKKIQKKKLIHKYPQTMKTEIKEDQKIEKMFRNLERWKSEKKRNHFLLKKDFKFEKQRREHLKTQTEEDQIKKKLAKRCKTLTQLTFKKLKNNHKILSNKKPKHGVSKSSGHLNLISLISKLKSKKKKDQIPKKKKIAKRSMELISNPQHTMFNSFRNRFLQR